MTLRLLLFPLALLTACRSAAPAPTPAPPAPAPVVDDYAALGPGAAWMKSTVDPCQDFYSFACGGMMDRTVIPADRLAWGPGLELEEKNELLLQEILETASKAEAPSPDQAKLGAWWRACMDEERIEQAGLRPIHPLLARVGAVKDAATLTAALALLHRVGIFAAFDIAPVQDFKSPDDVIAGLDQSGLGLPDRDYYLESDPATQKVRSFYQGHVARMLVLGGASEKAASEGAAEVLRIETALARLAQDKVVRRDPDAIYHKVDKAGLVKLAKSFPWQSYFAGLGFPGLEAITINSPEYFQGMTQLLAKEKPASLRTYLSWKVLEHEAPRLTKAFVQERFELARVLVGIEKPEPRWRRCVASADNALGEILGRAYVERRFDGESKTIAQGIVADVRAAMKQELEGLAWMDAETRAAAHEKLGKMVQKIGYPETWRSYEFEVSPTDHAANALASDAFEMTRQLKKVGKPVDRGAWQMTPPTVNAYYDPSLNEMVFPAGILQPPYFGRDLHRAVNYGATGATVGHELTHGFDDEGSRFDASGRLSNWWSAATGARFKEATQCVIDQYSGYEAVPGVKLNGALTAGENIADIGGLKVALQAFRAGGGPPTGLGDRLFFVGYAQSWCQKVRPELLETKAKSDPHSPESWRVNGVVANVPEFAAAFSCKTGAPLAPEKRCAIW